MDKKIIKFDNTEIEEYKFHQNKYPISINDINDISDKLPLGKPDFKYLIGYTDSEKLDFHAYSVYK